ncbi:hypothetical protein KAR91_65040, partial [Candidatus Pacearchaeota archaeon]|nr:hypothetical protein [Candidatus Pacearchaeota archaeon]
MNDKKHKLKLLFIFLIIFGNVTLPVFASIQDSNQISDYEHVEPSPPGQEWDISILFIGEPKLNRPVDIILETQALGDLNYTNIEFSLDYPDGLEIIGGDTLWKGNPQKDEKLKLKAKVKIKEIGDWKITGKVRKTLSNGDYVENTKAIFVSVSQESSMVTESPPENNWENIVGYSSSINDEGIEAGIEIKSPLKLNKKSKLEYILLSPFDINDARISLVLPDKGLEVDEKSASKKTHKSEFTVDDLDIITENQIAWRGDIIKGKPFSIDLTIKPKEVGAGYIFATVRGERPDGITLIKTVVLDVSISRFGDGRHHKKIVKSGNPKKLYYLNETSELLNINTTNNYLDPSNLQPIEAQPNNYSSEFLIPAQGTITSVPEYLENYSPEYDLTLVKENVGVQMGEKYLLEHGLINHSDPKVLLKYSPEYNITVSDNNNKSVTEPLDAFPEKNITRYIYFGNGTLPEEIPQEPIYPENTTEEVTLSESSKTVTFKIYNADDDDHYYDLYVDGYYKGWKYVRAGYTGYKSYSVSSTGWHEAKIEWYDYDDSQLHSKSDLGYMYWWNSNVQISFTADRIVKTQLYAKVYNGDDDYQKVYMYLDPKWYSDGTYLGYLGISSGYTSISNNIDVSPGWHTVKIKWYDYDDGQWHEKSTEYYVYEGSNKKYYFQLDHIVSTTVYARIYNADNEYHNAYVYVDGESLGYISLSPGYTKSSSTKKVSPGWHTVKIEWYDYDDGQWHEKSYQNYVSEGSNKEYYFQLDRILPTTLSVKIYNKDDDSHRVNIYIDPSWYSSGFWGYIDVSSGYIFTSSTKEVSSGYHTIKIKWYDDDDEQYHEKSTQYYVSKGTNQQYYFNLDRIEKDSKLYFTITNKDDDQIKAEIYVDNQYWGHKDIASGATFVSVDKPVLSGTHTVKIRWQEPDNGKWYEKELTQYVYPNERKNYAFDIARYNPNIPIKAHGYVAYYDENKENLIYIKNAKIEVLDREPLGFEDHIAWSQTDNQGYYYVDKKDDGTPIYNDDGLFQNGLDLFVRVYSENSVASVSSDASSVYKTENDVKGDVSGGLVRLHLLDYSDPNRGAFNIYNSLVEGATYVDKQPNTPAPPQIRAIWPDNDADSTSGYSNGIMYIEGPDSTDPDEWDESVILHEYGHFIMDSYADLNPPNVNYGGDGHTWTSHETTETAWIEGWSDFFQSVVRHYYNYPMYDSYVETRWTSSLENASAQDQGDPRGDDVEGAIASALWDIYDSNQDNIRGGVDSVNMGYDEIWNIFDKYDPDTSSTSKNHPWTVYDFWNGWMTNSYGDYTEVKSILADRGIYVGSTVKITEPNGGGWYKGNITVRATEDISGSTSSVEFQYSLDSTNGIDGAWNAIGSDNNEADGFSLQWNTVNIVDPSVWIRARGFDGREWGNWDSSDSSFGIDNSNPIVSI